MLLAEFDCYESVVEGWIAAGRSLSVDCCSFWLQWNDRCRSVDVAVDVVWLLYHSRGELVTIIYSA